MCIRDRAGAIPTHRTGTSASAAGAAATGAAAGRTNRDGAVRADARVTEIARNTTSPTRAPEGGAGAALGADRADEVTGGVVAPDEETGFGHGVDGLTPRTEIPAGGTHPPPSPPASGGATAPGDTPPATPSASPSAATAAEAAPGAFK